MTTIHITYMEDTLRSLDLVPTDGDWPDLTGLLSSFTVLEDKTKGPAIIPARFAPCPVGACKGTGKVDCGGGVLHRLNRNVTAVTALGCDLDDVPEAKFTEVVSALQTRGIAFWVWNTHSHVDGSGAVRARLLIPFASECPIEHPNQWSKVIWPALMKHLGLDKVAAVDDKCKDPSRIYYTPSRPTDSDPSKFDTVFSPGAPLDWGPVVKSALELFAVPVVLPEDLVAEPTDQSSPVDLDAIGDRMRRIKRPEEWVPLIKNVLAGKAPRPPPEKREGIDGAGRENAWFDITMALARVREPHENKMACLEILKPAYAASLADDPHTPWTWDKIVDRFERACEKALLGKAEQKAKERAQLETWRRVGSSYANPTEPPTVTTPPDGGDSDDITVEFDAPIAPEPTAIISGDWTDGLIQIVQKNGTVTLKNCAANVEHMLRACPAWAGVFRFNQVTQRIEVHGGPFHPGEVRPFYDSLVAKVADWLERQPEEFALSVGDNVVLSRIRSVAYGNAYDPLKNYLNGLEWDGTPRLDNLLAGYFSAKVENAAGEPIVEYVRDVGRRWAISAAARGLDPGCKVDTVLILEGLKGGEKKTTAFAALGGDWYTGQHIDIHNKDSWMAITQCWIVELGELETFRRSEVNAQKAFFSLTVDTFRKPYGYEVASYPRRCVFVGSTNKNDYLKDETGNRRYWPVECGDLDLPALKRDRDQIWAEAVHLFKAGGKDKCEACRAGSEDRCKEHRWWFSRDESGENERETESRMAVDPLSEKLIATIMHKPQAERQQEWPMLALLEAVGLDHTRGQEMRLGAVLRRLRFDRVLRTVDGHRKWMWVLPHWLLVAPQRSSSDSSLRPAAPVTRATA